MNMDTEKSYRFLYAVQLERPTATCQNCGHGIAQCFYIQHKETKLTIVVGCECVGHLLTDDHVQSVERNRTRLTRAAAQWRKQLPPALPNETRTEYINRRLKEMDNASKAHKDWVAACKREFIYTDTSAPLPITLSGINREMVREFGENPLRFQHFHDFRWERWVFDQRQAVMDWWREETDRRLKCNQQVFAAEHGANPFDFTKASWDVRKV